MTPLMPEELSAYLDGELPAARAREVGALLAADPRLRADFDALADVDRRWRAAGETAAFQPAIRLRQPTTGRYRLWALGVAGAILLRTSPVVQESGYFVLDSRSNILIQQRQHFVGLAVFFVRGNKLIGQNLPGILRRASFDPFR